MLRATLMSDAATGAGLMAASIAVGGFLLHALPALQGRDEAELRRVTVAGGIFGALIAVSLIVRSLGW